MCGESEGRLRQREEREKCWWMGWWHTDPLMLQLYCQWLWRARWNTHTYTPTDTCKLIHPPFTHRTYFYLTLHRETFYRQELLTHYMIFVLSQPGSLETTLCHTSFSNFLRVGKGRYSGGSDVMPVHKYQVSQPLLPLAFEIRCWVHVGTGKLEHQKKNLMWFRRIIKNVISKMTITWLEKIIFFNIFLHI